MNLIHNIEQLSIEDEMKSLLLFDQFFRTLYWWLIDGILSNLIFWLLFTVSFTVDFIRFISSLFLLDIYIEICPQMKSAL